VAAMLLFELLLPMSALLPALLAVAAGRAGGTMLPPPLLARGAGKPLFLSFSLHHL